MKSEKMWDNLAKKWDTPGVSLGEHDIELIEKTKKYLHDDVLVLDYGCATGSIVFAIAAMVKEAHGIDISSNMIEIAKTKQSEGQLSNTRFFHGTIFSENLMPASYDLILAFSVLHLIDDFPQAVQRIHQLLKPGGLFISSGPCLGRRTFLNMLINAPIYLASKIGILPHINFFTQSGLVAMLTDAGFLIVEQNSTPDGVLLEQFIVTRKN